MSLLIILMIAGALLGVFLMFVGLDHSRSNIYLPLGIGTLFFSLVAPVIFTPTEFEVADEPLQVHTLHAINVGSEISGRGGIFLTQIGTNQTLQFVRSVDQEGVMIDSVPVERSIIFENDDVEPRIEIYSAVISSKYSRLRRRLYADWAPSRIRSYHIYIPKGSIVREFTIDMGAS